MPSLFEAQRRHAQYYLEVLRAANELYERGGESIMDALTQFDQDWGQVKHGQKWTSIFMQKDELIAKLCNHYALGGVRLLTLGYHARERVRGVCQSTFQSYTNARRVNTVIFE